MAKWERFSRMARDAIDPSDYSLAELESLLADVESDLQGFKKLVRDGWETRKRVIRETLRNDAFMIQAYKSAIRKKKTRNPQGSFMKAKAVRIRRNARGKATHIDIRV